MAKPHFPNLAALRKLPDVEIRFYAVIGAVMSLTAALEIAYFDVFRKATKLQKEIAAAIFYQVLNTSTRRDMAGNALAQALKEPMKTEWLGLFERITHATGRSGHRNLLGHGQISVEVTSTGGGGGMFGASTFGVDTFGGGLPVFTSVFRVQQDEAQIIAGKRTPQDADFDALAAFCEEVKQLILDLEDFLDRVP